MFKLNDMIYNKYHGPDDYHVVTNVDSDGWIITNRTSGHWVPSKAFVLRSTTAIVEEVQAISETYKLYIVTADSDCFCECDTLSDAKEVATDWIQSSYNNVKICFVSKILNPKTVWE